MRVLIPSRGMDSEWSNEGTRTRGGIRVGTIMLAYAMAAASAHLRFLLSVASASNTTSRKIYKLAAAKHLARVRERRG